MNEYQTQRNSARNQQDLIARWGLPGNWRAHREEHNLLQVKLINQHRDQGRPDVTPMMCLTHPSPSLFNIHCPLVSKPALPSPSCP